MQYARVRPSANLRPFVEWFWMTQSADKDRKEQKIVPDGLPEMVFHFGDPYRIRLKDKWQKQAKAVFSGQLRQYCLLQNTGRTDIFGITFTPAALSHLFGLHMSRYCDNVVSLNRVPGPWKLLAQNLGKRKPRERHAEVERLLLPFADGNFSDHPVEKCLRVMRRTHGMTSVAQVCAEAGVTERQIQRLFENYVGLSPKYYARLLRFSNIFHLMREGKTTWADIVFLSGYYDQSHFIRDFKKFTGEDPTAFQFREENLTNFFAKKKGQEGLSGLSNPSEGLTSTLA